MDKRRDKNLLFAVLAVQLKGVSPDKVMEAASAWIVNPERPLSQRLAEANLLSAEDVTLLNSLVEQMVEACKGDPVEAIRSIHGAQYFTRSIIDRAPDATRLMDSKSPWELTAPPLSTMDEHPGRYSQISEFGKGGMGRVLLVHDAFMGRDIALKELLLPHDSGSADQPSPMREASSALARFLQEARITGQLEHPGIVPVYEVGRRTNGTLYYTMKLVRGNTMARAFHQCKSLEERMKYVANIVDLCQALAYAHHRGVIHRDIKPSNVMIGEFGETVLLDWGLAKLRGEKDVYAEKLSQTMQYFQLQGTMDTPMTSVGEALGTPHYMSPEQANGMIEALDERTDVYGMGTMIYELLTGQPPYNGATAHQIIEKVIRENPKPIRAYEPDAPRELVSICERAMARKCEDRYQTMKELLEDLTRFQTGAFVQSYKYNATEVLSRYYQRYRLRINTVAAVVLMLLAAGVYSHLEIRRAWDNERAQRLVAESAQKKAEAAKEAETRARDEAESHQYDAQLRLAQSYVAEQQMSLANEALENTPLVKRDWAWGYLKNRANQSRFIVHSDISTIKWAKFEPGGRFVVALRDAEPPGLWSGNGAFVRDFEGGKTIYNNAGFSEDGSRFAAIGEQGLDVWDTATGKQLHRITTQVMGYDLAFVPGSPHAWASYDNGRLVEWDLASGAMLREFDTQRGAIGQLRLAGKTILAVANAGGMEAWDLDSGQRLYTAPGEVVWPAPDGSTYLGNAGTDVWLADARTGTVLRNFRGHNGRLLHASFSANGEKLLTASNDASVRLWARDRDTPLTAFALENDVPGFAYFLKNDTQILACSVANRYSVRDAESGAELYGFAGTNQAANVADLSPDRANLLSCSATRSFEVFDAQLPRGFRVQTQLLPELAQPLDGKTAMVARDRSAKLLAYGMGSKILLFNTRALRTAATISAPGDLSAMALSADGKALAYGAGTYAAALDPESPGLPNIHEGHAAQVLAVALNADGQQAASCDALGEVHVWDAKDGATRWQGKLPSIADDLAFHGAWLVCGSRDGHLRVFDAKTGTQAQDVAASETPIFAVASPYSATGKLATLSSNGRIAFWNGDDFSAAGALRMEETYLLEKLPGKVAWYTDDDRYLTTSMAGLSYTLNIIDVTRQSVRMRLPGLTNMILNDNREGICLTTQGAIQFNNLVWDSAT